MPAEDHLSRIVSEEALGMLRTVIILVKWEVFGRWGGAGAVTIRAKVDQVKSMLSTAGNA